MRLYVPFTCLRAETYAACSKGFPSKENPWGEAIFEPLLNHEKDYGRYWARRWIEGETFINVEQDVVPTPQLLREMWECKEPYCRADYCYPWAGSPIDVSPIGCAKFSKDFIAANRSLVFDGVVWHEPQYLILNASLNKAHVHTPPALHLHVTPEWPLDMRRMYGMVQVNA